MPTVTIERSVTIEDTTEALRQRLGDRYEATTHEQGNPAALKGKQSATSVASGHSDQTSGTTTFRGHGGGLVISRLINEFGIAKNVATALDEAFKPGTSA